MSIVTLLAEIVRDLFIFVGAMAVLLVVLVIVISRLPDDNPLKRVLTLLSYQSRRNTGRRRCRHPRRTGSGPRHRL